MDLDPDLAVAIAQVESNANPLAARFEPNWKYLVTTDHFARANNITEVTERVLQSTSWGAMQVMGSVCREFKYSGPLTRLAAEPELALLYSCKKLKALADKYECESAQIAAYNAGTPRKDSQGKYENQAYVDKVTEKLKGLRLNG